MQAKPKDRSVPTSAYRERIPDNLLLEPIEFIFADHCRQANVCQALGEIAARASAGPADSEAAAAILHYLEVDLSLHIADEEQDLFPHISARTQPEDRFSDVLRLLDHEHDRDRLLSDEVRDGLTSLAQGEPLDNPEQFRRAAGMLVETHLSHLNWENAVVLPLARKHLMIEDLDAIGRSMAARRDRPYPSHRLQD